MNILNSLFIQPVAQRQSRGISVKSQREIEIMRHAGSIVATVLQEISQIVKPGMTTADLDAYAEKRIQEMGATSSFKGYHGFPGSICASINHEAVHGIPSDQRVIRAGDVLKIDTAACYQNFHGDSCITIALGKVSPQAKKLIQVAQEALYKGIEQVKAGSYLMDIAGAVQDCVERHGFSILENYTGHGIGRHMHEEPSVFNFRTREMPNVKLRAGMTLTIEPIVSADSNHTRTLSDGWTVVTIDKSLAAQFEHTVLVTENGYEILTDRTKI
ncbi:type I methionyl aminopeptidase [Gloeocapsopsis dulcis]|uniref:Methionine aminopeptidase n=1 Tax=Gloeocapsopsis dulcis AAB1 = 1H9 TaxID=1433147 RepID=A0A6N8FTA5_9CHRO|nr:type I methionyl aminopeptidase [Gloeocapsopsis dulcis]MUL36360.1 type I methionyl aminopeptidase [Gloeocapsopsis dulcis AAB1 = 1H9]WNN88144.1 type I methionyl aminopeptidase [Gloeocapsopsis dulcis]